MIGTMVRSANFGSAVRVNSATISPLSFTGRERSTEPMICCRFTIMSARFSSALMPLVTPMTTSRPA